jgi:hypothetical protein
VHDGGVAEIHPLPLGRALFVDERGRGLRVTWHHEQGMVNLSMWRDDRCVETFRLPVADVAALVNYLVDGLGEAAEAGTTGVDRTA